MFNPKTGARLGHIGAIAGLAGTAGAHLPSALGLAGLGNIANKLLTNESFRENLIKAMIKNKKTDLSGLTRKLGKAGAQVGINTK